MPRKTQRGRESIAKATARNSKSEGPSKKTEGKAIKSKVTQRGDERASKRPKSENQVAELHHQECGLPSGEQSTETPTMVEAAVSTQSESSKIASNPSGEQNSIGKAGPYSSSGAWFKRLYEQSWDSGDVEEREHYRIGGFHPVHIDDLLGEGGRFEVINKLGFGSHSTVWACLDSKTERLRAVKILRADHSTDKCPELRIRDILKDSTEEELSNNHVVAPLENLWINGPNGRHLCLVLPLVSPSVSETIIEAHSLHSPSMLKRLAYQIAKGTQFLHKKGICHGGKF